MRRIRGVLASWAHRRGAKVLRTSTALTLITAVMGLAACSESSAAVTVDATANPWAAGQAMPPEDGSFPSVVPLARGSGDLRFTVTGEWSYGGEFYSADGHTFDLEVGCGGVPCTALPTKGFSG